MAVVSAPMVVLMLAWPRWRWAPVVPILLVAVGLFGADYHFVSDMIAGTLLGSICAAITWRLMGAPPASGAGRPSRRS
jgi:membrane-associated phospholipid phosphatase